MENNLNKNTSAEQQFAVAESYKTIRTNLQFMLAQTPGCKVVTISSPKAGDGKTTNAINVAIAFSQLGKKVLLIDADLRRSSVCKKLKLENNAGLSGVLAGFAAADEVIISVSHSFDVMPAGTTPPNPSEMLASTAMEKLLDSLRMVYDYIILDTPPVGVVSDPLVIAPKTDGIVVILKQGVTRHDDVTKVLDNLELTGIRILGVVLNCTDTPEKYYEYKHSDR